MPHTAATFRRPVIRKSYHTKKNKGNKRNCAFVGEKGKVQSDKLVGPRCRDREMSTVPD